MRRSVVKLYLFLNKYLTYFVILIVRVLLKVEVIHHNNHRLDKYYLKFLTFYGIKLLKDLRGF